MAVYDFKCGECGSVQSNVVLKISHRPEDKPVCCNAPMNYYITKAPMVRFRDYELKDGGFRAVGIPGRPVVTSLKQNRELMRRHDLLDANELIGTPPTHLDQEHEAQELQKTIDAITPNEQQKRQLAKDGLLDLVT